MENCTFSELKEIKKFCDELCSQPDWREVVQNMDNGIDDFLVDGVRFIEEDAIDSIWTESLIHMIKDCHDLSDVPNSIEIDWNETVENYKVDGKGHHFNGYDGSEDTLLNYDVFDCRN